MKSSLPIFCLLALICVPGLVAAAPPGQGPGPEPRPGQDRLRDAAPGERRPDDARQREEERRQPRLSPEERRALRQQIHEAGHDLYRPKK